jgi:hypothetical protein
MSHLTNTELLERHYEECKDCKHTDIEILAMYEDIAAIVEENNLSDKLL